MNAFFLEVRGARLFCTLYEPEPGRRPLAAVLYVHPFAEEMNKSRRMAALQARALADAGHVVMQVDLAGCGDSSGEFGEVSWERWVTDLVFAARWLDRHCIDRAQAGLWWWGLRVGAMLAAEAAARLELPAGMLLWQAVTNGKRHLQQFLRLSAAGEMLDGRMTQGVLAEIQVRLARGDSVEIAGYLLSPAVAQGFEQTAWPIPGSLRRIVWLELSLSSSDLPQASLERIAKWRLQGLTVDAALVSGPAFWTTNEICESQELIQRTIAMLGTADLS